RPGGAGLCRQGGAIPLAASGAWPRSEPDRAQCIAERVRLRRLTADSPASLCEGRMRTMRAQRGLVPTLGLLIGTAWAALWLWAAFGIAAHLLDTALHLIVRQSTWLAVNGWMLGAIVLATAGAFQFTRLKYRCLDRCRTPFSFIAQYWRGRRPGWNAFLLGGH